MSGEVARLRRAVEAMNGFVEHCQGACESYLNPGDVSVQSEKQLANALIALLDGPWQREVQHELRAALAAAEQTAARDDAAGEAVRLLRILVMEYETGVEELDRAPIRDAAALLRRIDGGSDDG